MTDIPFRVYGPQAMNSGLGEVMYTAPTGTSKFFIRDLTFSNINTNSAVRVVCTLGSAQDPSKRVIDQTIATSTATSIRPLWLMDAGETLQGFQVITALAPGTTATTGLLESGTDTTAYTLAAWTPAANTTYILIQNNGVASGTTALNPSSITGNGSWTLINQTTSTVAAAANQGLSAWWWDSTTAGSSATTVVNFASTQHSFTGIILSVQNILRPPVAVAPWTTTATPVLNSAVAADTTAPGSTASSLPVTLGAIQTGYAFYLTSRVGSTTTTTPPTSFTEAADRTVADGTGSIAQMTMELSTVTTAPWTSPTLGPATFATSTTGARASVGWEMVPGQANGTPSWVNCMVSGIEVH